MLATAMIGSCLAERFVLEALAGSGGMGAVYRARDLHTGQTIAIKLLQSTPSPEEIKRFAHEAELLSGLSHPGIVAYHAHGVTEAGEPYLAMEWLEGEDLSRRLSRGKLRLSESVTLLRRVAEALVVAHTHGVVHRDIKPSNLFLRDGDVERVALLDFGIARGMDLSHGLTRTGVVLGTPAYMAPEQARGDRYLTPAADVFSLGCVLFECLSGRPPFVADHVLAVLAKVLFDEPPPLCQVRPEMPEQLEALLGQMLAKDMAVRLPDAAALLVALTALDDLPLDATLAPPASASRSRRVDTEQYLITVLMATLPGGIRITPASVDATLDQPLNGVHVALAKHGARVEMLADGSLVATLAHAHSTATDQADQAARLALLVKTRCPEATIALSTGRGLLGERLPVGEVLDRAARLLREHASSPPSERILLDEVTSRLLNVRFRTQLSPSGAHELLSEELLLDASRPLLGKPTPCVGRDVELDMLERTFAGCVEEAAPRAVLVTAAPGVGKSRLRHELLRRVEAQGKQILILIGLGDPMSAGSAYGLLGQALRRLCGIRDGESLEARRAKLAQRAGERLPAAERERVVAFLGELCGAPFPQEDNVKLRAARQDPLLMSDQITQAMLDFLRAECAEHPTLLVLEDLHWGDALTVKLCELALGKLKDCPLMVLALARPEVNALFPKLWSGAAQVLPLRRLGKKAGERLVQQVLGAQVSKETIARLVEQSAGNALFLEELIRSVAEGRGDEAPETVLAMLQARIGRLSAGARRVLRAASVFGETAWLDGIRALLDGSRVGQDLEGWLSGLMQDEILEQRSESRAPADQAYRFRHALMRDAAYGLLTAEDRADAHRLAGEYLEARGGADAVVLAEHFLQGKELSRAIHYFIESAEQSFDASDMDTALSSSERGLACGAAGEQRGALLAVQSGVYFGRERYAEQIALCMEALELLPEGSRRWCQTAQYLFPALSLTQQPSLLAQLSSHFPRVEPSTDARSSYLRALSWLSIVFAFMGEKESSRALLARARQIGAALDRKDMVTLALLGGAEATVCHVIKDAPWTCMRLNAESREAFRAAGEQRHQSLVHAHYGKALMDLGDWAGADAALRDNLAFAEQLNEAMPLSYARVHLARLLAASAPLGELAEPARLAGEVIAAKNMALIGVAHGALAEIKLRQGDLPGAEAESSAACQAARPFPAYSWDLIALRIRILLEQGRASEALQLGQEGVQELERLGLNGCGEIALRLAVAEAHHAAGQSEAACARIADAISRLRERMDDIPDAAARERYVTQVPVNARLLALAKAWLGEDAVELLAKKRDS